MTAQTQAISLSHKEKQLATEALRMRIKLLMQASGKDFETILLSLIKNEPGNTALLGKNKISVPKSWESIKDAIDPIVAINPKDESWVSRWEIKIEGIGIIVLTENNIIRYPISNMADPKKFAFVNGSGVAFYKREDKGDAGQLTAVRTILVDGTRVSSAPSVKAKGNYTSVELHAVEERVKETKVVQILNPPERAYANPPLPEGAVTLTFDKSDISNPLGVFLLAKDFFKVIAIEGNVEYRSNTGGVLSFALYLLRAAIVTAWENFKNKTAPQQEIKDYLFEQFKKYYLNAAQYKTVSIDFASLLKGAFGLLALPLYEKFAEYKKNISEKDSIADSIQKNLEPVTNVISALDALVANSEANLNAWLEAFKHSGGGNNNESKQGFEKLKHQNLEQLESKLAEIKANLQSRDDLNNTPEEVIEQLFNKADRVRTKINSMFDEMNGIIHNNKNYYKEKETASSLLQEITVKIGIIYSGVEHADEKTLLELSAAYQALKDSVNKCHQFYEKLRDSEAYLSQQEKQDYAKARSDFYAIASKYKAISGILQKRKVDIPLSKLKKIYEEDKTPVKLSMYITAIIQVIEKTHGVVEKKKLDSWLNELHYLMQEAKKMYFEHKDEVSFFCIKNILLEQYRLNPTNEKNRGKRLQEITFLLNQVKQNRNIDKADPGYKELESAYQKLLLSDKDKKILLDIFKKHTGLITGFHHAVLKFLDHDKNDLKDKYQELPEKTKCGLKLFALYFICKSEDDFFTEFEAGLEAKFFKLKKSGLFMDIIAPGAQPLTLQSLLVDYLTESQQKHSSQPAHHFFGGALWQDQTSKAIEQVLQKFASNKDNAGVDNKAEKQLVGKFIRR